MNILFLNWKDVKNNEAGGAEIIAFEYARRLVKDGHEVTIFCRTFPGSKASEVVDGVNIIRRGSRTGVYFEAWTYYMKLDIKPDLVIDMVNTLAWQTPLYVPKKNRITYVNQLAKEVLFYEFKPPLSWLSYYLERLQYLTYKNSKFICYSESTKKDLEKFGIPKREISTFSLGIDHKRYRPGGKKAKYPLFIFVARLVRMKRADLCIRAMQEVVGEYPDAKLVIIGRGPEEERLQELVGDLGLGKNVDFVMKNGFYVDANPSDLKLKFMQEAWALVLPSVKEGWGMVVTEAAACGTPSIVSNVTGLVDSTINKKTGLVISKNPSTEDLSGAMKELISNKKYLQELSKNALMRSREFSWDKSYLQFKTLILRRR